MWKQFFADYFAFTKKERVGTLVLLAIIVLLAMAPMMFSFFIRPGPMDNLAFQEELAALKSKQSVANDDRNMRDDGYAPYREAGYQKAENRESKVVSMFQFDPNTLSAEGWRQLGLREKTIATIQNYLSKGGKFKQPADIRKIWGLSDVEKDRLEPYVSIKAAPAPAASFSPVADPVEKFAERKPFVPTLIDINSADTTAFIALPGIGNKLAQRIVNFRDKLGGFRNVEQLGETFGLPDSTFQKIKPRLALQTNAIRQININTATLDEMKAHPYLRYAVANAIVQYRTQHGNFKALTDLRKIMTITDEVYAKAAPYLTVQ